MAPFRRLRNFLGLRKKPKPLPNGVSVGRYSYGITRKHFHASRFDCQVHIGAFCSIAEEVVFVQMADHDVSGVASFPIARRIFGSQVSNVTSKGAIVVGNDVWIGRNSLILSGVTIGDGAVVGAGSVVTRSVPPYSIVAGNPAEVRKYRFSSEDIALLLEVRWWEWDEQKMRENEALLTGSSEQFLSHFRKANAK